MDSDSHEQAMIVKRYANLIMNILGEDTSDLLNRNILPPFVPQSWLLNSNWCVESSWKAATTLCSFLEKNYRDLSTGISFQDQRFFFSADGNTHDININFKCLSLYLPVNHSSQLFFFCPQRSNSPNSRDRSPQARNVNSAKLSIVIVPCQLATFGQ